MKNIEWFEDELDKLKIYSNPDVPKDRNDLYTQYVEGVNDTVRQVKTLVGELNEPEVLSLEFINEKAVEVYADTADAEVHVVFRMRDLQNLLVPKQELPVIPKFVAGWIEKYVEYGYDLYPALKKMENNARSWERTYDWYRNNTLEFVLAYLTQEYEIEVEKEQKYIVSDKSSIPLLIKNDSGEIMSYDSQIAYNNSNGTIELTEQEIKDYDPRYFAFAKPVEELEE